MKWYIYGISAAILILACVSTPRLIAGFEYEYPASDAVAGVQRNFFDREPVLFFETSGYTLAGMYHRRLSVYSDGTVSVSKVSGIPNHLIKGADFSFISLSAIEELQESLIVARAHLLGDQKYNVQDVPLSTVTFFANTGPRTQSNTFNYFLPQGVWADVDAAIDDFIDMWFPGF